VILVDARTYPARQTAEPDSDRVMQGSHDGFVETLVVNTALIRRRVRDPRLRMKYIGLDGASCTDIALCYMDGVADPKLVKDITERLIVAEQSLKSAHKRIEEIRCGQAENKEYKERRNENGKK
jgi:stage V sporulation protein AF